MGRSRLALGEPGTALELLEEALELQGDSIGRVTTLLEMGICQRRSGDLAASSASLAEALELAQAVHDPELEAATRAQIARLERDRGNPEVAVAAIESALEILESLRSDVPSPDLRASFFSGGQDDFGLYIGLLLELESSTPEDRYAALAFEASERARARTLVELLAEARIEVRRGIDPELKAQETELAASLSDLQQKLVRELSRDQPRPERVAGLRDKLETLKARRRDFEVELRRSHPRYADIRYPEPLTLSDVQGMLDGDTALLQYFVDPESSYLFVVTDDRFSVEALPDSESIATLVRSGRHALEQPGRRLYGQYRQAARELYDLLIEPAAGLLEDKRRLLIAPSGDLHLFPFEALLRPDGPSGDGTPPYLITRWSVAYVPSASALASLQRPAGGAEEAVGRKTFVAFADPEVPGIALQPDGRPPPEPAQRGGLDHDSWRWRRLPGARRESRLFLGIDANEANVKNDAAPREARILHFASHALVDGEQPAYSALLMSASPDTEPAEDGLLQVHEIFNLDLDADLVVLSACETALGRRVRGEGLIGLTQAFLYAGARSVSVSLWPVADESTADLMVAFYRRVNAGESEAEALREAKLDLIRSPRQGHPYYWAPFVLVGNPG
jgi:CHAT domain-containing protein